MSSISRHQQGLDPNWRSRLSTSTTSLNPQLLAVPQASRRVVQDRRSGEAIAGFTDGDVGHRSAADAMRVSQVKPLIILDADAPVKSTVTKKPRAPRTLPAAGKSTAFRNLPEWAKPHFDSKDGQLVPTLVDFYGRQVKPWNLDYEAEDVFHRLLQLVVDQLAPEEYYEVMKGSQVYRRARQAVYDWRSNFQKSAIDMLKAEFKGLSPEDIKGFVRRALLRNGDAFWETPGPDPRGALRSSYILSVFAEHLQAIQRSILDDNLDVVSELCSKVVLGYPEGALTLSACAVHRAFNMFSSGVFVASGDFSEGNTARIWENHAKTVAENYVLPKKAHRFRKLVCDAHEFLGSRRHSRGWAEPAGSSSWVLRDPSSPAPMDDDVMDDDAGVHGDASMHDEFENLGDDELYQ